MRLIAAALLAVSLAGCGAAHATSKRRTSSAAAEREVREAIREYDDANLAGDATRVCAAYRSCCSRSCSPAAAGAPIRRRRSARPSAPIATRSWPTTTRARGRGSAPREKGRWRIDSDEPHANVSMVGSCVWGYSRVTLADPEWKPWSDRAKAEYTQRFCQGMIKRGLLKVDHGLRLARLEQDVVNSLYDDGLMIRG